MVMPAKYRVWVVDNKRSNYEIVERSIPDKSWLELRHVPNGAEFLQLCQENLMNPDKLPHIVLLDFFLGEGVFAEEVIPQFDKVFEAMTEYKPYVIAFSSMPNANDAMIALGVPWSVLKEKGKDVLPELTDLFKTKEKLGKHMGQA